MYLRVGKYSFTNEAKAPDVPGALGSAAAGDTTFDSMAGAAGHPPLPSFFNQMSQDKAMRFTAVFAAIRLRAENIASLPKIVTVPTSGGARMEATEHSIYKLLKYKPNPYMNIFTFWEYINACQDGWGNAYCIIQRGKGGEPAELYPVHPQFVTVTTTNKNGAMRKWFVVSSGQSHDGTYSDDDMLHFFTLSKDGLQGMNPIVYNASALSAGIAAQTFTADYFKAGGTLKGVMETEKTLSKEAYAQLASNLSANNNFGTPILDQGIKYKAISISPEAAQLIDTRTFNLQDVARIFNVPPHLLGDLSRATFSNIEHQDIQFVKYSLRPAVKRYEVELENKLLFDLERGEMEIKFNLDGLLRGDTASRAKFYREGILDGYLSRNEVRQMEGLNPVPELDKMLYPSNEFIVGDAAKGKQNNGK